MTHQRELTTAPAAVSSEDDIHGDAVYFIRTDEHSFLVRTPHADKISKKVRVQNLSKGAAIKPFSRRGFVDLGRQRKMVLLTHRGAAPLAENVDESDRQESLATSSTINDSADEADADGIDMGAFSQLLTSAQRSGLLPGADQIA